MYKKYAELRDKRNITDYRVAADTGISTATLSNWKNGNYRYDDKDKIVPQFEAFKRVTGWDYRKMGVYVLCGFDTTLEQDLERIYTLRDMGYTPYVMIYEKYKLRRGDDLIRLQRWVNSKYAFASVKKFENYKA